MNTKNTPLVSVVTPTYNGEKYLRECIESVLSQTYSNWEYIIVNNCSKDRTLEIVQAYAARDPRIRVYDNEQFLSALQNHNHALGLIADHSRYCKILQADDWLYPECIERMVALAEAHPSVGVVGSYRLMGDRVDCDGLAVSDTVFPGHEICRMTLMKRIYVFGSPSTTLIRSDVVRARERFYSERSLHADVEVCYEILKDHDFGFVHQVLSFTRLHEESRSARIAQRYRTNIIENLGMLMHYGPGFLSQSQYRALEQSMKAKYYRFLAASVIRGRARHFGRHHQEIAQAIGFKLDRMRLARAIVGELADILFNPGRTLRRLARGRTADREA